MVNLKEELLVKWQESRIKTSHFEKLKFEKTESEDF
jgi:hypothetical protein